MPDSIPFGSAPISPQGNTPDSIPFGSPPISTPTQKQPFSMLPSLTSPGAEATGRFLGQTIAGIEKNALNSVIATPIQAVAKAIGQPDPFIANPMIDITGQPIQFSDLSRQGLTEKVGALASTALLSYFPKIQGIFNLKLAALGGVTGGAQSLASGTDVTAPGGWSNLSQDVKKGIVFAGILGTLGSVAHIVSNTEKATMGISPAMENELSHVRPSTLASYINTAVTSSKNYHAPAVDDIIANDIQKGADILTSKIIPEAGQAVGDAKKLVRDVPVMFTSERATVPLTGTEGVTALRNELDQKMQEMTGHQFTSSYDSGGLQIHNYPQGPSTKGLTTGIMGEEPLVSLMENRPGAELSLKDQKALESVVVKLNTLQDNPTVQTASDIIHRLDDNINWERPQFGPGSSPVDGYIRWVRGAINRTIAPAAPELAQANERLGALKDIKNALGDAAGKDLQNINLLARRTTYRDQQGNAQNVLDNLFNEVKSSLPLGEESYVTKAIIGQFARDTFGGERGISGLSKSVSSGEVGAFAGNYMGRIVTASLNVAKRALAPNPEQYAMSIAKGEPYSFIPFVHHIDEFVDSASSKPIIQSFKNTLKSIGVSSSNTGIAAKAILRMIMIQHITQPIPSGIPTSNQQSIPFNSQPISQPQSMAPQGRTLSVAQPAQQAINQLTPATTGQGMSRRLGTANPGGLNLSSNLSLS